MSRYYPVMLALAGKKCVIVGGGAVAERKASALLEAGAEVTVVSPSLTPALQEHGETGKLAVFNRKYERGDVAGAFLVYAAADDRSVNEAVFREAEEAGALVNVADDPARSGFIVPAVMNRGLLQIAVSTSGASPGAAAAIKAELAERYGEEYELFLEFLSELRAALLSAAIEPELRSRLLRGTAEWDVLSLIRGGTFAAFRRRVLERAALPSAELADLLWSGLLPDV